MFCTSCGYKLDEGARFCAECGAAQEQAVTAPVYETPPEGLPQEQAVTAPVYEAPPAEPPQEQAVTEPVYEAPPEGLPQETGFTPSVYEPPPGYQPQETGYAASNYAPPPYDLTPSSKPVKAGGNRSFLKILIPIIAIVVVFGVLAALEGLRVIDIIPSWPGNPASGNKGNDLENINIIRPSTPPPMITSSPPSPVPSHEPTVLQGPGEISVNGETDILFFPDISGAWVFRTGNSRGSDPNLTLTDWRGDYITEDDDFGGGGDALMVAFLDAGESYTVAVGFSGYGEGNCSLTISPAQTIQGSGGDLYINEPAGIVFTPSVSGIWVLSTSDNASTDPIVFLFDSNRNILDYDDDSGGGDNALITIFLEANVPYVIIASYNAGYTVGGYKLTVELAPDVPPAEDGLSGMGGNVRVTDYAELEFVPSQTGVWVFITWDSGACDPYVQIRHESGELVGEDDDSAGGFGFDYNAFAVTGLMEEETYYIVAGCYGDESGEFTLTVLYLPTQMIGDDGGVFEITGLAGYFFIPGQSGEWKIWTSDNEGGDPVLFMYDVSGEDIYMIAYDDDGLDGLNALITMDLNIESMYYIIAGFYGVDTGRCNLNVSIG